MIRVDHNISIGEEEIQEEFVRSSGPGGQHVNKTSTAVQLRFDVAHSPSLPQDVRGRLMALAGNRMTDDGVLIIEARQYRSQDRNRQDALGRLIALIRQAAGKPKRRRETRPTRASLERRLEIKRQRGQKKRSRAKIKDQEDV
jgi:ribosome-associated protein